MGAVLTNGVHDVALVKESFSRNSRKGKDNPMYIRIRTEYYNDDANFFYEKKGKNCCESIRS